MSISNAFTALFNLGSEFIEDPDKRNKFNAAVIEAQCSVRIAELQATTIPWVDALHKMWRPATTAIASAAPVVIYFLAPDIEFNTLMLLTASAAGPTGLYTMMKGRGR